MVNINLERCTGCGACVEVCPEGALYLVDGKAAVDTSLCRECEACVAACPMEAITITSPAASPEFERVPAPVLRPEPAVIRIERETVPAPLRSKVLPVFGAALTWAGRELVPRLATYLLDSFDRRMATRPTSDIARSGSSSANRGGSGQKRRHRHRGGRGSGG